MPSGKRSRAIRHTAPPVREQRADSRILVAVAGAVVLIVAALVLAVALTRGGSSTPKRFSVLPGAREAVALYAGIPQHGLVLGSATAPVRMVAYIDLQCPVCRDFEATAMPDLVSHFVRTGKVRLELRPWAFIGPDSVRGQAAVFAAAQQNRAFQFAQVLYANQGTENTGWLTDDMIGRIAGSVPRLDVSRLLSDRSSHTADAASVAKAAAADSVNGTPTVLVGGGADKPVLVGASGSVPTTADVTRAIEAALAS
jgi:protein-disulfide isomerase